MTALVGPLDRRHRPSPDGMASTTPAAPGAMYLVKGKGHT
jgi:hypothetical protein